MRPDFHIISSWIKKGSRVLDLGCGNGTLLAHLQSTLDVTGYGLEIENEHLAECISKSVHVIQSDLNEGLCDFDDSTFDYVIMTHTLQAIHHPDQLLAEMLRVGREGIVTFYNAGHWRARLGFLTQGYMPLVHSNVYQWYNSPNIHLCTVRDFEKLCHEKNIHILERSVVDDKHRIQWGMRYFPNIMGKIALYRVQRQ